MTRIITMKLYKSAHQKTKAQAMVEFAIVLPLLLLLLYGILEAGRLLFIYSTVVTASRQAVRYGSATGQGLSTTIPRYQDCAGIRLAAQKVDFLNSFNDDDIVIKYDTGPGSTPTTYCTGAADTSFIPSNANTNRLLVTIDGDYLPIIPKMIPFIQRSVATGNPIKALSARTILVSVAIIVTVPPSTFIPSTPTHTPSPTASPTPSPTNTPTPTLTPTLVFTSTPTITASPTITSSPTLTPTITNTPTITPTIVTGCGSLNTQAGQITISGGALTLTIPNTNPYPVTVKDLFVTWNSDKGHQAGTDKSLILQSVGLLGAATPFWTGNPASPAVGPSAFLTTPFVIPANGVSTLVFTFHQSYDKLDASERTFMNLLTPGCEGFPIDRHF
jgi:Flp pilus assembly protein TadG